METLFIGTNIIYLPEVDSNNSYAMELLKNVNPAEGTVIHTAHQTAGRGQRGNVWNTLPTCNLTASVIINPSFLDLKKQFFLYKIAALACYDVMAEILDCSHNDIKIKWPNDILVNGRKVAGILIENVIAGNTIQRSIMGIGINVNQDQFAPNIHASSLLTLSGKRYDVKTVLQRLCSYLEKYYLMLKTGNHKQITELYMENFYGLGRSLRFEIDGKEELLVVKGISPQGLLLLESDQGEERQYDVKEVKWLVN